MLNRLLQCTEVRTIMKMWNWHQESLEISGCSLRVCRQGELPCDQTLQQITQPGLVSAQQPGTVPSHQIRGRAVNRRTQMPNHRSYYCTNSIWHLLTGCSSRCQRTNARTSQVAHPVWDQLATFPLRSQLPMILLCNLLTFEQELTYSPAKLRKMCHFFFFRKNRVLLG